MVLSEWSMDGSKAQNCLKRLKWVHELLQKRQSKVPDSEYKCGVEMPLIRSHPPPSCPAPTTPPSMLGPFGGAPTSPRAAFMQPNAYFQYQLGGALMPSSTRPSERQWCKEKAPPWTFKELPPPWPTSTTHKVSLDWLTLFLHSPPSTHTWILFILSTTANNSN